MEEDYTYHDAVLRHIQVFWEEKRVVIALSKTEIVASNVRSLIIPMRDSWGPSAHIFTTTGPRDHGGYSSFSIQMQSGDVIEIEAAQFHLPEGRL
jgi:hypothetical protein